MIGLIGYGSMIADKTRIQAYQVALRGAIEPGCTVLDIGAGTGIFSLLACQLGAGHVHAIEPNNSIQLARKLAVANGFSDRISFYQALSQTLTLPVPADVIVSDLRGALPLHGRHIPAIIDARRRFLAPDGVLIPQRDTLWAALVEDPELYRPYCEPWLSNDYGLDMHAGHPMVINTWKKTNAQQEQLLVQPQCWATLDYTTIENPHVAGELNWSIDHPGTTHGLLVWFDTELATGVGYSNAPGRPKLVYGQGFFPFREPVKLLPGDAVFVRLRANLTGGDYIWQWNTLIQSSDTVAPIKANFAQSTFLGETLTLAQLHKQDAGFRPALDEVGRVDQFLLSQMDGRITLGEIATRTLDEFPGYFANWNEALTRAAKLSSRYAR